MCLEHVGDPVVVAECGHVTCRACAHELVSRALGSRSARRVNQRRFSAGRTFQPSLTNTRNKMHDIL